MFRAEHLCQFGELFGQVTLRRAGKLPGNVPRGTFMSIWGTFWSFLSPKRKQGQNFGCLRFGLLIYGRIESWKNDDWVVAWMPCLASKTRKTVNSPPARWPLDSFRITPTNPGKPSTRTNWLP